MRRANLALAAFAVVAVALAAAAAARAADDPAFGSFLARFRAALARNDAGAVADLTRLPFLFDGEPRDRAGFVAIYPELFDEPVRECIAEIEPKVEGEGWTTACGPILFYYGREGSEIRLLEFGWDPKALP